MLSAVYLHTTYTHTHVNARGRTGWQLFGTVWVLMPVGRKLGYVAKHGWALTVWHCTRVSCYVLESRTLFHRQCVCGASVYLYYFGFCTRAIYIIVIHISLGPAMRGQSYLIIKAICCIDVGTFGTVSSSVPATQLNCIFNSRSHGWPYIPFTPGFNCCVCGLIIM